MDWYTFGVWLVGQCCCFGVIEPPLFHQVSHPLLQTLAYTNKYNLPDDSRTREILIRRHTSIRRSLRASSFREPVGFALNKMLLPLSSPLAWPFTHLPLLAWAKHPQISEVLLPPGRWRSGVCPQKAKFWWVYLSPWVDESQGRWVLVEL